jgi:hypothetical protein
MVAEGIASISPTPNTGGGRRREVSHFSGSCSAIAHGIARS